MNSILRASRLARSAHQADSESEAIRLAEEAFKAFSEHPCDSCALSSLALRVSMINRFGPSAMDAGPCFDAVRDCVPGTPEAVLGQAQAWREWVHKALALRKFKSALSVLHELAKDHPGMIPEDLRPYLEITHKLP